MNTQPTQAKHTPGQIRFEGWFPPRETGLLPSVKANWDGRTIQMFTDNLEQGETDLKFLAAAPAMFNALQRFADWDAYCKANADSGQTEQQLRHDAEQAARQALAYASATTQEGVGE